MKIAYSPDADVLTIFSSSGVVASTRGAVTVTNNTIIGNSPFGVSVSADTITLAHNTITGNFGSGVALSGFATAPNRKLLAIL